jgi:alpha-glucosidase
LDGSEPLDGGRDIEVTAPIDHIPVFVRAGAVLPMDEDGELTLHLYAGDGGGRLYRDAGDGYGPHRIDRYTVRRTDDTVHVETTSEGDFPAEAPAVALHGALKWGGTLR